MNLRSVLQIFDFFDGSVMPVEAARKIFPELTIGASFG
jgi:hypothetical protein